MNTFEPCTPEVFWEDENTDSRPDTASVSAEALAWVLNPEAMERARYAPDVIEQAERLLADPGPLLDALAQAGVLTEERATPTIAGAIPLRGNRRRYVIDWKEADR